jgi:SagB-type dehydrogenase family enzyme
VLARRRFRREFANRALTGQEIAQLLWPAQEITADWGGRTSSSAGALYPLELFMITPHAYGHYVPRGHRLEVLAERDLRREVAVAALAQPAVRDASLMLVLAGVCARTTGNYGARGRCYVALEAGHVARNVLLRAVALGVAGVPIGAFDDQRLARTVVCLAGTRRVFVAVGHPCAIMPA